MLNYLLPRLENLISELHKDILLIAKKNKSDEWKRDHYRYTFTVSAQRIYEFLNTQLTGEEISPVSKSTKEELIILRAQIDRMIND